MTPFGTSKTGEDVWGHEIAAGDLRVRILSWGAAVQDVRLQGVDYSLTLGSDRLSDYEGDMRHHGTLIGPVVNRISTARVIIEGMTYELERNQDGRINLHSGRNATHLRNWTFVDATASSVTLSCDLMDGECELPGNRQIVVTYEIQAPATLMMRVTGTTDATTLMNCANHCYWNLDGTETFDGHQLWIDADHFLPSTADFYPTGDVLAVDGTEMDFRTMRAVAPHSPDLDNNFCLNGDRGALRKCLALRGKNGLLLEVITDQPGIQLYDGRAAIRPGRAAYEGLAIEAQKWPDAPNNPMFPSIKVRPDAPYKQETHWQFSGY